MLIKMRSIGNKAKNLEILADNGIAVPKGFTLSFEDYELFKKGLFDSNIKQKILSQAKKLHSSSFAVRSSGKICGYEEDSANVSLAGQFESFLNVTYADLPYRVLDCYKSLFNERTTRRFGISHNGQMSVLIQEMIPSQYSSVVMTLDPIHKKNMGLEVIHGPCEQLVDGSTAGDYYEIDANYNILNKEVCANVSIEDEKVRDLAKIARKIEDVFGLPQDIEAVYDTEWIVVQSRNITT